MAVFSFDKLNSTNSYLKQNFSDFANFDVISAEEQTDGYGRFKRKWYDLGKDNIFMSICLKFDKFNENIVSISQYTALILAKTFESYDSNPSIKWPNDVLISSKKISGILAETVFRNSEFSGIVLGLGINLNADNDDLSFINQKATALNLEIGKRIDKTEFINKFMTYFKSGYSDYLKHGFNLYKDEYILRLNSFEKQVTVTTNNHPITGIVKGINNYGMLILDINGKIEEISAGDISLN